MNINAIYAVGGTFGYKNLTKQVQTHDKNLIVNSRDLKNVLHKADYDEMVEAHKRYNFETLLKLHTMQDKNKNLPVQIAPSAKKLELALHDMITRDAVTKILTNQNNRGDNIMHQLYFDENAWKVLFNNLDGKDDKFTLLRVLSSKNSKGKTPFTLLKRDFEHSDTGKYLRIKNVINQIYFNEPELLSRII